MLTQREIQLASEVVQDLRSRGDQEHAAAASGGPTKASTTTETFFTVTDAARRLGIRPQTLKHWIESGKLAVFREGPNVLIPRQALLDCIEHLRDSPPPVSRSELPNQARAAAERAFILRAFPDTLKERLHELVERQEEGQPLTEAEEGELDRLEEEASRISAMRLWAWTRQRKNSSETPT